MDDRLQKLIEKARALPKTPGVYLMKDDKGRVIYIGKSASLRERVSAAISSPPGQSWSTKNPA
jgi:excinuclease ABC subunit C